jgi:hypothetical protein
MSIGSLEIGKLCFAMAYVVESDKNFSSLWLRCTYYHHYVLLYLEGKTNKAFETYFFQCLAKQDEFCSFTKNKPYYEIANYFFWRAKALNIQTITEYFSFDRSRADQSSLLYKIVHAVTDWRLEKPAVYSIDYDFSKDPLTYEDFCYLFYIRKKKFQAEVSSDSSGSVVKEPEVTVTMKKEITVKANKVHAPTVTKTKPKPSVYQQIMKICNKRR